MDDLKTRLAHMLWIGGATDAGKTTVAQNLADQYGLPLYRYDVATKPHFETLAQTKALYRTFLSGSNEDNWVKPTPEALLVWLRQVFIDQWPFVLEDLLALPSDKPVLAEGFGFLPALLAPLLTSPYQAIWLVPTEPFKWWSMKQRDKYTRRLTWAEPERAIHNLFTRDRLLAEVIREQGRERDLVVFEVDGSIPAGDVTHLIAQHFSTYLSLGETA